MTRFIGIASGKGGVGRTTVAINLSTALHKLGREVVLVDAHLSQPHVALQLGSTEVSKSLHHALHGKIGIKEAAYKHSSGLKLIPGTFLTDLQEEVDSSKMKDLLLDLVGTAEVVIVDMGTEGKVYNDVLQAMDEVIIVATPDLLSVNEAMKTIKKARDYGVKVIGAILNRVKGDRYEMNVTNIETMLDHRIIGIIHESEDIRACIAKNPLIYEKPDCAVAKEFKVIAANLIGDVYETGI